MSDWAWGICLEILAGLMEFVMKDWIGTGIWNKPAWDDLGRSWVKLWCGIQLPTEHRLPVWSLPLGRDLAQWWVDGDKLRGPWGEELMWSTACSAQSHSLQKMLPATQAFQAALWCCMGDDSLSCTGLIRLILSLQQKMNGLGTWKWKGHILNLNENWYNPVYYQRQKL